MFLEITLRQTRREVYLTNDRVPVTISIPTDLDHSPVSKWVPRPSTGRILAYLT